MRSCDYCGKENDDAVSHCAGCGCSLDEPKIDVSLPWAAIFSWGGYIFGLFANISMVFACLPFYVDHSSRGPGMIFWFIGIYEFALVAFLIGVPCGIVAIKKGRRRIGWSGLILGFTPAPLAFALLEIATKLFNLPFD
jgi:hypothetical protein